MPFGSFQVSDEDAMRNAIRFVKEAGADAVKLEGAGAMLSRVQSIVAAGIPVMGHIGLTPQSATMLGGYKAQGRSAEKALALLDGRARTRGRRLLLARARGGAGAGRARGSRGELSIPTIGIGAGADCDGQVLVWHDLLGLYQGRAAALRQALRRDRRRRSATRSRPYADDVRERRFPEEQHTYAMPEEELALFEQRPRSGRARSARIGRRSQRRAPRPRPSAAERRGQLQPWTTFDADEKQRQRPRRRRRAGDRATTASPVPSSAPPLLNVSPPKSASRSGSTRRNDSASGTAANPTS